MKNLALIIILGLTSFVAKAESDIEFKEGNSYTFAGPVTEESVDAAITGISSKSVKFLILDTPGGSIDAGYRFISFLKTRQDIACVVQQAASMGFVIFQACGTRYVLDHSLLMQHQASLGLPPMKVGNLLSTLKGILGQLDEMDNMQAKRMGLSLEKFKALIHDDLWLFSGAKAVDLNAADKVVTASCSQDLINKKVRKKEIVQMFIFKAEVEVELSLCPLILTKTVIEPKPEEAPAK